MTYDHLKWPGIVENATGKRRKKSWTYILANCDPCIYKEGHNFLFEGLN